MSSTKLVILDSLSADWISSLSQLAVQSDRFEILLFGVSQDQYLEHNKEKLRHLSWCFVDTTPLLQEAQKLVRDFYPNFMYKIAQTKFFQQKSLYDFFQQDDINYWWFLEFTEKSPVRGTLINNLYFLTLLDLVFAQKNYDAIIAYLSDRLLLEAVQAGRPLSSSHFKVQKESSGPFNGLVKRYLLVRYFANVAKQLCNFLLSKCFLFFLGKQVQVADINGSVAFFSFYPSWWKRAYQNDAFDVFFTSLPDELSHHKKVVYFNWLEPKFSLFSKLPNLKKNFVQKKIIFLNAYLSSIDILRLISPKNLARLFKFHFIFSKHLHFSYGRYNLSRILVREIAESMTSKEYLNDILIHAVFQKVSSRFTLQSLIYRIEFQPYEKAILYGIGNKFQTIGFQHATFGNNHLSYFFVPAELSLMPQPHYIFTTGKYAYNAMLKNGFPREKVLLCGPVRYSKLCAYVQRPQEVSSPVVLEERELSLRKNQKIIVVATSVVRQDSLDLLYSLAAVVKELESFPYIIFKTHPALVLDKEFQEIIVNQVGYENVLVLNNENNIYDYFRLAHVALFTGTTLSVEALALGCFPILYETGITFDAKSMAEFSPYILIAHNKQSLQTAILQVFNQKDFASAYLEKKEKFIEEMFDTLYQNPNDRFLRLLDDINVLH